MLALVGAILILAGGGWLLALRNAKKRAEAEGTIDEAKEKQEVAEQDQLRRNQPASRRRTLGWLRK